MGIRRAISVVFALVGAVVAVIGLLVVIADREVFDKTTVEHTLDRILADPDVGRLLGREITNRAVALADLEGQRPFVQAYVDEQLATTAVRAEVRKGAVGAYEVLMETDKPRIDFNMPGPAGEVRRELVSLDPTLDNTLPTSSDLLRFTLFERSALPSGYDLVKRTRSYAWGLFIAGVALVVVALVLGPSRLALFTWVSAIVSLGMLFMWMLVTRGGEHVLSGIDDPLTRRVARLSTEHFLARITRLSIGVVIFGVVAFLAGIGAIRIRGKYFPPKPKVVGVKGVAPIPPASRPPGLP